MLLELLKFQTPAMRQKFDYVSLLPFQSLFPF